MAPKVQGTRIDSIHRVPPSFLSAKTLQHCKHTGLNQAYFTRSLIINTFFASLTGVNFIRKKQEYAEVLRHYFTQCVCTGHTGVGHSLSIYIYYELLVVYTCTYFRNFNVCKMNIRAYDTLMKCVIKNVCGIKNSPRRELNS